MVGGVGTGVLVGGNLAMLAAEVGTAFSRPAAGGIVVLEEVGEEPYRIDRLLTQLVRTGWFDGVAGVVVGAFTDCGDEPEVEAVIDERLRPLGVPMVRGFDLGHTDSSATVPLGVEATLDADAGTWSSPARAELAPGGTDSEVGQLVELAGDVGAGRLLPGGLAVPGAEQLDSPSSWRSTAARPVAKVRSSTCRYSARTPST